VNILVVEDDVEMARLLVQGLEEESHEVDLARDGQTALTLSKSNSFDLILLDIMLPGIDGYEVAKRLRCRKEDVPVLMLTARDALPDVVKGLDAGLSRFKNCLHVFGHWVGAARPKREVYWNSPTWCSIPLLFVRFGRGGKFACHLRNFDSSNFLSETRDASFRAT